MDWHLLSQEARRPVGVTDFLPLGDLKKLISGLVQHASQLLKLKKADDSI